MFNNRLKQLRLDNNLTQKELGMILNKTKNNISQYETGKREPDNDTLYKIAEFFSVSLDFLLGKSDILNPYVLDLSQSTKAYHSIDTSGLSNEDIEKVEEYIELLKHKYNSDGSLKNKK